TDTKDRGVDLSCARIDDHVARVGRHRPVRVPKMAIGIRNLVAPDKQVLLALAAQAIALAQVTLVTTVAPRSRTKCKPRGTAKRHGILCIDAGGRERVYPDDGAVRDWLPGVWWKVWSINGRPNLRDRQEEAIAARVPHRLLRPVLSIDPGMRRVKGKSLA